MLKKSKLKLFLILSSFLISNLFAEEVKTSKEIDLNNYLLSNEKYDEYRKFYYKYVDSEMYFDSEGVTDFEYICKKEINTIDCRFNDSDYLKFLGNATFKLFSFHYNYGNSLYSIIIQRKNKENKEISEVYYIDADRLINSLNKHFFYDSIKSYYYAHRNQIEFDYSYVGNEYLVDLKKFPSNIYLCKNNILLMFDCDKGDILDKRNVKIKITDLLNFDDTYREVYEIEIENKKYFIDYYFLYLLLNY